MDIVGGLLIVGHNFTPQVYLTNIIARVADHRIKRIDELLPWNFAQANANHAT